jgi:RNA polymerase sigma factor (sigma-70 family)
MSSIAEVGAHTDTELVAGALANDQQAWNALVEKYNRLVWHVVHGFHQLDAERRADVHQTVWLRLAERLHAIRDPERVGGWLATTARHECLRQIGRQAREFPESEIELEPHVEAPERHMLETERDATLWQAFSRLRPACQQLLRLLICDPPFSYDEIAEILDLPRGSIGPTRQRCLDALRKSPGVGSLEEAP